MRVHRGWHGEASSSEPAYSTAIGAALAKRRVCGGARGLAMKRGRRCVPSDRARPLGASQAARTILEGLWLGSARRAGSGGSCAFKSGRPDLNRGPHRPERCALPGCATPREERIVAEAGRGGAVEAADGGPLLCWSGGFKAMMMRRLGLVVVAVAALLALPARRRRLSAAGVRRDLAAEPARAQGLRTDAGSRGRQRAAADVLVGGRGEKPAGRPSPTGRASTRRSNWRPKTTCGSCRSSGARRNGSPPNRCDLPVKTSWQRWAWQKFLREAARRYGPEGEFWEDHTKLDYLPITHWEIWNEENIVSSPTNPNRSNTRS